MGPKTQPKFKGRKYKLDWEQTFPWVTKAADGERQRALCKLCKTTIQPRKSSLENHEKSADHSHRMKAAITTPIASMLQKSKRANTSTELKVIEVKLAASVCCHMSFVAFDHVGELIREGGKGSILEDLKLHRTKLSRLGDHVINPAFKKELKEDINGSRYSLLCDETTDVSTQKTLSLCIVYFSPKTEKIETAFLGLYPVIEATGEKLFRIIQEALVEVGLFLPQCVVVGSDGASNMVGES